MKPTCENSIERPPQADARFPRRALPRPRTAALLASGLALVACQALPPMVSSALVGFGQDVLAAAAQNFAPGYAQSMQNLLFAMAETVTGAPFTQQAQAGYQDGAYDQPAYEQGGEGSSQALQEDYPGGYGEDAWSEGEQPGYPEDGGYVAQPQAAYDQASPNQGARPGIGLEIALLAQQRAPDGQVLLRPVADGDTLHDGRGDPARGDKLKLFFSANCACFVYVIGIDATGYVAQIFPEGDLRATSRVLPGSRYLLPEGTSWWGLDDYRGVEQIYFIASRERRRDIEDLVAQLAGQRPSVPSDFRPVREPAIVAMTRGLVQVQSAAPTAVQTEYGASQQFSPTLFQSTVQDADLVITRWFRHD